MLKKSLTSMTALGIQLEEISDTEFYPKLIRRLRVLMKLIRLKIPLQVEAEASPPEPEEVAREAAVFDDEILEIFLEEAKEIAATARALYKS